MQIENFDDAINTGQWSPCMPVYMMVHLSWLVCLQESTKYKYLIF